MRWERKAYVKRQHSGVAVVVVEVTVMEEVTVRWHDAAVGGVMVCDGVCMCVYVWCAHGVISIVALSACR